MRTLTASFRRTSVPASVSLRGSFRKNLLSTALLLLLLAGGAVLPSAVWAQEPPQDPPPTELLPEIDLPEDERVEDEESGEFQPALWEAAQAFEEGKDDPEELAALSYGVNELNGSLRYNDVQQKSSHNSYQRDEALLDQLQYHRIRSLELDIHNGKDGWGPVWQDWYVYHGGMDKGTTCHRLSDCLRELRSFHDANPYHEVITVFLDLKDDWETNRNPGDLDSRILNQFPTWMLFRPNDLMTGCPAAMTLQASVQVPCRWPFLTSLRGKFIFVLTGGDVSSSNTPLSRYTSDGSMARNRVAFVAPKISNGNDIRSKDWVVFFNMASGSVGVAPSVFSAGFVGRVYDLNDRNSFLGGRANLAHHLGTNLVSYHADPDVITHNGRGWPFFCIWWGTCSPYTAETANIIGVEVNSDDIWGSKDHFRFLYEVNPSSYNTTWKAMVSTPNSHVEPWAKGCLMARETTANNSRYFAVCRPADEHKLRVQWRTSTGGSTTAQESNVVPSDTVDPESVSHIALVVYNSGRCAAGYGSLDGINWVLIGYQCFSAPLQRQGLATSAHGNSTVKFLYTKTSKNGAPYSAYTFPYALSIGTVRGYWAFNGPFH